MRKSRRVGRATVLRFLAVASLVTTAIMAWVGSPANAAATFANPAFQTQWTVGEALAPNFWGPLALAREGRQEQYVEATGGMRLVQYFDKARMELTNTGTVTNGLLANELITGRLQLGDNTFQQGSPAGVPVAGDPDQLGPTYASINANSTTLLAVTASVMNTPVTRSLTPAGQISTFTANMSDTQAVITAFDGGTLQHNVPRAFVDYRTRVGLPAIGLAITEPFWSNVKVNNTQRDVLIQAFERRILTYTPTNEERFRVEFGNIGRHYYTWRYESPGALNTPTPASFPITATANANATATAIATGTAAANATASATAAPMMDTTAPKLIAAPRVPYVTPNSLTVTWETDEPGSSELLFGETENYEQQNTLLQKVFAVDHQVVVRNLTAGKTYHYRVQTRDAAGNLTRDDQDRTVTLPAEKNDASMGAVPQITNIAIVRTSATTFTVRWETNVASRSRIEYGRADLSTSGSGEALDRYRTGDNNDPSTTSHTTTAVGLEPNKAYRFRVVAVAGENGFTSSASNDALVRSTIDNELTKAESVTVKITELTARQERAGRPTVFTFGTDRNATIAIEIGRTANLGGGFYFSSQDDPQGLRDYPYPLNRTLHSVSLNLRPGIYYYRVSVYGDDGTGTSETKVFTVT